MPAGTNVTVNAQGSSLSLNIGGTTIEPPVLRAIDYDPNTNAATLTYESVNGEALGVLGGEDLENLTPLPDTVVGDGSVLHDLHNPPGSPAAYYYQLTRN